MVGTRWHPLRTLSALVFRWMWAAAAGVCIVAALLVGVLRLLLPLAPNHLPKMESWLSQATQREVSIDALSCDWAGGGPICLLEGINLSGKEAEGLHLPQAELSLNLLLWMFTEQRLFELRVKEVELTLLRTADEKWQVDALGVAWPNEQASSGEVPWLLRGGRLTLSDSTFLLEDRKRDRKLGLFVETVTLTRRGSGVHLSGRLAPAQVPGALIEVVLDTGAPEPGSATGPFSLYVGTQSLPMSSLAEIPPLFGFEGIDGAMDFRIWARVADGELLRMHGDAEISRLRVRGEDLEVADRVIQPRYSTESIALDFQWNREGEAWRLGVPRLEVTRRGRVQRGELTLVHLPDEQAGPDQLSLQGLRADDVADLLMTSGQLPAGLRSGLYQLSPHGVLDRFELVLASDEPLDPVNHLRFVANDLSWVGSGSIPGGSGASIDIRHAGNEGWAEVVMQDGSVDFRGKLRGPVFVEQLQSTLHWQLDDAYHVQFDIEALRGQGFGLAGQGQLNWLDPDAAPSIDLTLSLGEIDIARLHRFWPQGMPPEAIAWLDRSLNGGRIASGGVLMRGPVDQWPFLDKQGRFEVTADVRDARMDYVPGWPEMVNGNVEARFEGASMFIEGTAEVAGIETPLARAEIADLRDPLLVITARGQANDREAINFLRISPLGDLYGDYLQNIDIQGPVGVDLRLDIPLGSQQSGAMVIDGVANLQGADVSVEDWGIRLAQLGGALSFDADSVTGQGIAATLDGHAVDMGVRIGGSVLNEDNRLEATLRGKLPITSVFRGYPDLDSVLDRFDGQSDWFMNLELSAEQAMARLQMESDLVGTAGYLPEPMGKSIDQARPMRVEMTVPEDLAPIKLWYGDTLAARFAMRDSGVHGQMTFGGDTGPLPTEPGIRIDGYVERLDWSDWVDDMAMLMPRDARNHTATALLGIDLRVGWLRTLGSQFTDITIDAQRDGPYFEVNLESDDVSGQIRMLASMQPLSTVVADFDRVHWPENGEETQHGSGFSMRPEELPTLSMFAAEASIGDFPLGELRLETYPIDDGVHFDSVETRSELAHLTGSGDWVVIDDNDRSDFDFHLTTEDLGSFLSLFDIEGQVEGGQTIAALDVGWDGAPTDISSDTLEGVIELSIGAGQFPQVSPGAGRLLGLISLQAIPRRLALDFSDLVTPGLSFDSINATLQLRGGNAYTKNLTLQGPSADLEMEGRIGLVDQDYDMILTVRPKVSSALPLVGALAGGGTGAAAMFLFESIMADPLSRMSEIYYSVTGSWDEPELVLLPQNAAPDTVTESTPQD